MTATSLGAYESLSQLLRYPDDTYRAHLADCAAVLLETEPDAAQRIVRLYEKTGNATEHAAWLAKVGQLNENSTTQVENPDPEE